ncbi:peptide MFS transporter [Aquimarina spongiae]|uniref:Proton-dependent oligopeptide transporter, POT family n=1 Tax=Aquimarina spongiae TaxID=570521 RepID=A0A1M6EHE5_9FLAO|nr:peptide MFS transporter [Aquimarina spongiae]SHI84861.1 proton-dependent oligopeptide transporter, POT family [Aquimarina spongiae]
MSTDIENLFKDKVLGHPAGLFIIFFTEMWERFSFYGMRILLVIFLTAPLFGENPGWANWPREHALALFGTYASLLYLTPILGGYIADKITGYRWAVVIGCLIMTLGHLSMAFETEMTLYLGLALLVIGTGLFKPNITSIISEMYKGNDAKKDGAYTIFYMGVNAGAFFGIMLCGYLGENYSWALGFGLAGIFMFLGMIMFWLARNLFGDIGAKPNKEAKKEVVLEEGDKLNPFTALDKVLIAITAVIGFTWLINDPMSKIGNVNLFDFSLGGYEGPTVMIVFAVILFVYLIISRILRYSHTVRDRMFAVAIFAFFTIFFWAAFEQAAGSLNIFARDYTARDLSGSSALIFKVIDTILTVVPLAIITWVLYLVFRKTFSKIGLSNVVLSISFLIIWGIVIWKLNNEFSKDTTEVGATWFGILNSFFIIALAPLFSKWWESKYNPSAAFKYGFGLGLLGFGFALLAYGSSGIPQGAQTASVSMVWLILAYLFHTLGELCLSPVGLSYLSKLVPGRMIAFMFGIWYLAIAIGQKAAGTLGGMIDEVTANYNLSTFFLIFTVVPIAAGILIMLLNPIMKKLMHGVR